MDFEILLNTIFFFIYKSILEKRLQEKVKDESDQKQ